ncbi:MAG: hypothetical protein LBG15_02485 [Dysgonamonadaceae bacterium]|jgi:hypothetical protein|nr:hypothetical protein [Dysgonamonadaceae bacterium]
MKKIVAILTSCFCLGLLGLHAETKHKSGFNGYKSAAENYSASKTYAPSALSDEGGLRADEGGAPSFPADPGTTPIGTGLGIISLCSCVYILFQSRKKNEKTI